MYNDHKVKPLHEMLPKTGAYIKRYDAQTKWMYLLISDYDLSQKYNTIWDKISADTKKYFDSETVYNKNFLKTQLKSHANEVPDFYDKKNSKSRL